jgi:LuxR family transcriptional regulator, quorum-sensing system regulator SdiA
MTQITRVGVAALLHGLDQRSPAGCAIGLHIRFTTPRYMFQSYAERWREQYTSSGLLFRDPTVRWGMNNVGWARWCDLEAIDSDGILERARDYGLTNGVTVALVTDGSRSIASFARSDREYETPEIVELEAIFHDLHLTTANPNALSDADRAALRDLSVRLTH